VLLQDTCQGLRNPLYVRPIPALPHSAGVTVSSQNGTPRPPPPPQSPSLAGSSLGAHGRLQRTAPLGSTAPRGPAGVPRRWAHPRGCTVSRKGTRGLDTDSITPAKRSCRSKRKGGVESEMMEQGGSQALGAWAPTAAPPRNAPAGVSAYERARLGTMEQGAPQGTPWVEQQHYCTLQSRHTISACP